MKCYFLQSTISYHSPKCGDLEILTLNFPKSDVDMEIVWCVGTYMVEAWKVIMFKDSTHLSRDVLFGFLKYKCREDQFEARPTYREIPELM